MYGDTDFLFIGLSASLEIQNMLVDVSEQEHVHCINHDNWHMFLEEIMENHAGLLVMHTNIGMEVLEKTLIRLQTDSLCESIPVVIISDQKNNEDLAFRVKDSLVISILTYENWNNQLSSLIHFLTTLDREEKSLKQSLNDSRDHALRDDLTGTLNRSGAEMAFQSLVAYNLESSEPFSILMYDIDFFKKVNDTYGHDIGDEVLVAVSNEVKSIMRKEDSLFRFGGEEFIIFLSNTSVEVAIKRAEDFRMCIKKSSYSQHKLNITASFGVTQYQDGDSLASMIHQADALLYKAKSSGRDRVVYA